MCFIQAHKHTSSMHQWRQSMRCKKEKASTRGAREKTMSADTPIAFSLLRHRIRQPRNILFDLSAQIFDWGNSASICVRRMRQNSSFMCLWSISKWFVFLCACVVYYTAFSKCVNASFWGQCHCCVCAVFLSLPIALLFMRKTPNDFPLSSSRQRKKG